VSPKIGQKLTDNPKENRIQFRMDNETVRKLDCVVAEQNSDRSKVIRKGIEIQYEQLDNSKKE
jgi:predicted transcriptional regulator